MTTTAIHTTATITVTEDALAEALFVSPLQRSQQPTLADIQRAIYLAFTAHHFTGIAGLMAAEFGDHPETAIQRMAWVRDTLNRMAAAAELALAAAIAEDEHLPLSIPTTLSADDIEHEVTKFRAQLANQNA